MEAAAAVDDDATTAGAGAITFAVILCAQAYMEAIPRASDASDASPPRRKCNDMRTATTCCVDVRLCVGLASSCMMR